MTEGSVPRKRAVSKRVRFEVFKRDGFVCVYCGATPIGTALHVDHVEPLASGGSNAPQNLVTACSDCNGGKGAVKLDKKRFQAKAKTADKDHLQQILSYLEIQRRAQALREQAQDELSRRWQSALGPMTQGMYNNLIKILATWPMEAIDEAMRITARNIGVAESFDSDFATQQAMYFHGILRRWKKHL